MNCMQQLNVSHTFDKLIRMNCGGTYSSQNSPHNVCMFSRRNQSSSLSDYGTQCNPENVCRSYANKIKFCRIQECFVCTLNNQRKLACLRVIYYTPVYSVSSLFIHSLSENVNFKCQHKHCRHQLIFTSSRGHYSRCFVISFKMQNKIAWCCFCCCCSYPRIYNRKYLFYHEF